MPAIHSRSSCRRSSSPKNRARTISERTTAAKSTSFQMSFPFAPAVTGFFPMKALSVALVEAHQSLRRHPQQVESDDRPVSQRAVDDAFLLVAARRCYHGLGQNGNAVTAILDAAHDLHILHQGDVRKPAKFFEIVPPEELCLVAVGDPREARSQAGHPRDEAHRRPLRAVAQVEGPGHAITLREGVFDAPEGPRRKEGVGMEEEKISPPCRCRPRVHLPGPARRRCQKGYALAGY